MVSKTAFVSGRVPARLSQALDDYAESTGTTRTAVLISALSTYLGLVPADYSQKDFAKSELALRVEFLDSVLKELNLERGDILSRIEALEMQINSLK